MTKKIVCPKCKSENITKIIYGQFNGDKEIFAKIKKGEVKLGGCCVKKGKSPVARCRDCGYAWGDETEKNEKSI